MQKLLKILLLYCIGNILSVKDIPRMKDKVCDAITRHKSILLNQQAARRELRVEHIDRLLDEVIAFYSNPPQAYINAFSYIGAYDCYKSVVDPMGQNSENIFDFQDIVEILEMLARKKVLIKHPYYLLDLDSCLQPNRSLLQTLKKLEMNTFIYYTAADGYENSNSIRRGNFLYHQQNVTVNIYVAFLLYLQYIHLLYFLNKKV